MEIHITRRNKYTDFKGNLLILDLEIDKHRMTLVNLYGPNHDDPHFYDNLQGLITLHGNIYLLL